MTMLFHGHRIHQKVTGFSFYSPMPWAYPMRDYPDGWAELMMVDLDSEYSAGTYQTFGKGIFQHLSTYGLNLESAIQLGAARIISSVN